MLEAPALRSASTQCRYFTKRTGLRAVAIVLNVAVAIFASYFSDMTGLIGALGSVMTTFVLPALFYVKLRTTGPAGGHAKWVLPIVVGVISLVEQISALSPVPAGGVELFVAHSPS